MPSFTSAGNVHFNDGPNVWTITVFDADGTTELRKATITDTVTIDYAVAEGGKATGLTFNSSAVTYSVGTGGIISTIENTAVEDNYPTAVGARAKRKFTFDLTNIVPNGGRVKIKIEGCGGSFTSKDFFFCRGLQPAVASSTLSVTSEVLKRISGVTYLTQGTKLTLTTGNLTNLNNQLITPNNKLIFESSEVTAPANISGKSTAAPLSGASLAYDNTSIYENTAIQLAANKIASSISIGITPVNYFATGGKHTASAVSTLVNSYTETASTEMKEEFFTENMRLKADDLTPFSSADSLVDKNELQVIPAVGLVYPKTDYSVYAHPAGNPNYSELTGSKYFVRKFTKAGSLPGGTLSFKTDASVAAAVTAGNLKFLVSKDGNTWFNATFGGPGNQLGTSSSVFNSTTGNKVVFNWSDGDANGFFYVKIEANASFAQTIKSITLA